MAQIYAEGNVLAHVENGSIEPVARCYDARDESFRTVVVIGLLGFLPISYGDDEQDHNLPSWKFAIEAIESCAAHEEELWTAWDVLRNDEEF